MVFFHETIQSAIKSKQFVCTVPYSIFFEQQYTDF